MLSNRGAILLAIAALAAMSLYASQTTAPRAHELVEREEREADARLHGALAEVARPLGLGGAATEEAVRARRQKYATRPYPTADATHMHGLQGLLPSGLPSLALKPLPRNETEKEKVLHHSPNCFNLAVSDGTPLDRPVPDHRDPACFNLTYPVDLPDTR